MQGWCYALQECPASLLYFLGGMRQLTCLLPACSSFMQGKPGDLHWYT